MDTAPQEISRDGRADGARRTGHDQATDHSHGRCDSRCDDRRDDRRAAGRRQQMHSDEPRVVARGDLLTSGWSAAQIDGAARRWRRLLPGVWLVGDGPGAEGRGVGTAARAWGGAGALPGLPRSSGPPIRAHAEAAALSWAGEHAALDASSAARRWGLRYVDESSIVQVVVAADSPRRSRSSTVASSVTSPESPTTNSATASPSPPRPAQPRDHRCLAVVVRRLIGLAATVVRR